MVIVTGDEFMMGSPVSERGRSDDETEQRVRIPRTYALSINGSDERAVWAFPTAHDGQPRRQHDSATRLGS